MAAKKKQTWEVLDRIYICLNVKNIENCNVIGFEKKELFLIGV